jgi:hypothetical protein
MTALGKLQFAAAEMELALLLARHAPNDFLGRAVARHVVVRAKDFIALCYDAASALKKSAGSGAVADVRERLDAYRDAFDEYYATTRTKLGAHVQPVEFAERLELWTDLEVGKLSYFVDGAREVYDAFAELSPPDYTPYATFRETTDLELLGRLAGHAKGGTDDGYASIGADVFAASRPRTVSVLNFTPVHQRAGELAAIDEWIHGQWAMLRLLDTHPNAARIVKSRILTDIVSFADCLTTRSDGDPAHRYPGLDALLKTDGDASAITEFRGLYRFQEKLDELRGVRNHVGAHLDRNATRDVATLINEVDCVDWTAAFRFYDRLRSVYRMTCSRTHFLVGYLANGYRLNGVMSRADDADAHVVPFNPARAVASAAPQVDRTKPFDVDSALDAWLADGPETEGARSFLWDAFMYGTAAETIRKEDAHVVRSIELRAAHIRYRERLLSEPDPSRLARLLDLASECSRGDPEPLGVVLSGYHVASRPQDEATLLALANALGQLPVRDAEWMRKPLRAIAAHDAPLLAASAVAALYKSLLQDRAVETTYPDAPAIFIRHILPMLEELTAARRLLTLLIISSRFSTGASGAHGAAADYEDRDVLFATCLTLAEVVGNTAPLFNRWRELVRGRDYVGVSVLVGEELRGRPDAYAHCFPAAAALGMISPSRLPESEMQSLCNLAAALTNVGEKPRAIETAMHVLRVDPLAIELHLALMPLLVEAGVPRERVREILDERLATYVIDPKLKVVVDAARAATAEPP